MSTVTAPVEVRVESRSLRTLARVEARRYARSPVFLVCAGIVLLVTVTSKGDDGSTTSAGFLAALLIGVFGCVLAYRLTRSTETSAEAMDCAPVPITRRTAALCLACLVPVTFVALWSVLLLVMLRLSPVPAWAYANTTGVERFIVLVGTTVVACLGGPLLGVAAGRWLRFPGAGFLVAVGLVAVTMLSFVGRSTATPDAVWSTAIRLLSPYAFFTETGGEAALTQVLRYPGSPYGYLVWQLALCGLAAVAAMLYGADRVTRSRLHLWGVGLVVVAIVGYGVAVFAGPDHSTIYRDDGTVTVGWSTSTSG